MKNIFKNFIFRDSPTVPVPNGHASVPRNRISLRRKALNTTPKEVLIAAVVPSDTGFFVRS